MTKEIKKSDKSFDEISGAIKLMCHTNVGALDKAFLCQSIGVLNTPSAIVVHESASLDEVLLLLQEKKRGCVGVVDAKGVIIGIFSERDFVVKVARDFANLKTHAISDFMTKDPVTQPPDCTIAFALNLMSQGGFRNLPVVDQHGAPLAIVSVKDVVDYLVESFTSALLDFPVDDNN